jgi:hypothetical protein
MPRPGATIASATLLSSMRFMGASFQFFPQGSDSAVV